MSDQKPYKTGRPPGTKKRPSVALNRRFDAMLIHRLQRDYPDVMKQTEIIEQALQMYFDIKDGKLTVPQKTSHT